MATTARSTIAGWHRALTLLAATLLCTALLFGGAFAWHVSQAGRYAATYVVISSWAAGAFVLLSLFVVALWLVLRRLTARLPGDPPMRSTAVVLTGLAWGIIALIWLVADA